MNLRDLGEIGKRLRKMSPDARRTLAQGITRGLGPEDFSLCEQVAKRYAGLTDDEKKVAFADMVEDLEQPGGYPIRDDDGAEVQCEGVGARAPDAGASGRPISTGGVGHAAPR